MALKDSWNDKVNGKDIVDAEDINSIARAVIEIEERETGGITQETDPTVPAWAKQPNKPTYTADEVGADKSGTASSAVSSHNTNTSSHNDIRLLIEGLTSRLNALANSDDTTLDQMAEVVEYIKDNRELLEQVTTGKVSVTDIVDNLTTNTASKPLSAKQGVALKALIDAITVPTKLSELTNDKGYLTQHQDLSAYAKTANHYTKTESDNKYRLKSDPYTLTEADKAEIVQSVLDGIGSPVYGFMGEDNHITLKGNLAEDRNYTFAYEMDNGTIIDIGKAEFVPEGPSYTNQIPISTDTDGSVYGFKSDTYISSSSGAVSAKTGICTTGFIPCDNDDVIRFENLAFNANASNGNYFRIAGYDKDKKLIKLVTAPSIAAVVGLEQDSNGVWKKFVLGSNFINTAFIRVCCEGMNENSIITINEEIV